MKENILKTKSFNFAVESIGLYRKLNHNKEFILSKQYLRSATSVGANIREANNAQSPADFVHKLHISQKECDESMYWLELMLASTYIEKEEFDNLHNSASEILRIIRSSILTVKNKHS